MADYVKFDANGIVVGMIVKKYRSVDGADIKDNPDILMVDRPTLLSITKFHKVDNGQVIVMTPGERDVITTAEEEGKRQQLLAEIDKFEVSKLDLLIALVKRINVRIPSNPITKQEIIDQIKLDMGI